MALPPWFLQCCYQINTQTGSFTNFWRALILLKGGTEAALCVEGETRSWCSTGRSARVTSWLSNSIGSSLCSPETSPQQQPPGEGVNLSETAWQLSSFPDLLGFFCPSCCPLESSWEKHPSPERALHHMGIPIAPQLPRSDRRTTAST